MRYNIRKILCSTSLSLIISLLAVNKSYAQGNVSLSNDMPLLESDNSLPDEVSLFDSVEEENNASGLISPPSTGLSYQAPSVEETINVNEENITLPSPDTSNNILAPAASSFGGNSSDMGDNVLGKINNDLFAQMSDIEKQTTLLNLELRREKIKSEIEALRIQRQKAQEEETAAREEKERKRIEWEKEQERKLLEEQRKLREVDITLEKLRQGRVVNAYKENMLIENQNWIESNEKIYKDMEVIEKERDTLTDDFKNKLKHILDVSHSTNADAKTAKENFVREKENLQTQISVLKARLEAAEAEKTQATIDNPFAEGTFNPALMASADTQAKLADTYAVMEITGQGEDIVAKLINKEGTPFMIRKGTTLSSGHIIDTITQTYIRGDKGGSKDYIYFSAGGVLENEPSSQGVENYLKNYVGGDQVTKTTAKNPDGTKAADVPPAGKNVVTNKGVPSLNDGMFIR